MTKFILKINNINDNKIYVMSILDTRVFLTDDIKKAIIFNTKNEVDMYFRNYVYLLNKYNFSILEIEKDKDENWKLLILDNPI